MTRPRVGVGPIWAAIYLALALGAAAFSAYMHVGYHQPLLTPYVLIPALGAVWFLMRAVISYFAGRKP